MRSRRAAPGSPRPTTADETVDHDPPGQRQAEPRRGWRSIRLDSICASVQTAARGAATTRGWATVAIVIGSSQAPTRRTRPRSRSMGAVATGNAPPRHPVESAPAERPHTRATARRRPPRPGSARAPRRRLSARSRSARSPAPGQPTAGSAWLLTQMYANHSVSPAGTSRPADGPAPRAGCRDGREQGGRRVAQTRDQRCRARRPDPEQAQVARSTDKASPPAAASATASRPAGATRWPEPSGRASPPSRMLPSARAAGSRRPASGQRPGHPRAGRPDGGTCRWRSSRSGWPAGPAGRPPRRGRRPARPTRRGSLEADPSGEHHVHALAEGGHLGDVVRRHQHSPRLRQQRAQLEPLVRVETVRRLVEHQQVGAADQRAGERDPLPHAAGQAADLLVHHVLKADRLEHPSGLVAAASAVGVLLEHGDVVDEVEGREARVERRRLRQVAEPAPDLDPLARDAPGPDRAGAGGRSRARAPSRSSAAGSSCPRRSGRAGRSPAVRWTARPRRRRACAPYALTSSLMSMAVLVAAPNSALVMVMRSSGRRPRHVGPQ